VISLDRVCVVICIHQLFYLTGFYRNVEWKKETKIKFMMENTAFCGE
jgi:hypothetical protein